MKNFFLSIGFIVAIGTSVVELLDLSNKRSTITSGSALRVAQN